MTERLREAIEEYRAAENRLSDAQSRLVTLLDGMFQGAEPPWRGKDLELGDVILIVEAVIQEGC